MQQQKTLHKALVSILPFDIVHIRVPDTAFFPNIRENGTGYKRQQILPYSLDSKVVFFLKKVKDYYKHFHLCYRLIFIRLFICNLQPRVQYHPFIFFIYHALTAS